MKKLISILFLFPFILNAHIDIFNRLDGEILPYEAWNQQKFSFDVMFNQNIQIDEIGIDYFNVGDNDSSTIQIKIFENEKIIFQKKFSVKNIYNQSVFLPLNIYLKSTSYRFEVTSLDNDDLVSLFKPNTIPYTNSTNTLTTTSINIINNNVINKTESFPFIHFAGEFENDVDLSLGANFSGFTKTKSGLEVDIKLLENQQLYSLGMNNYNLDSGNLIVKIINKNNNDTIFLKDTTFTSYNDEFSLIAGVNMIANNEYKIIYEFSNIKNLYINKLILDSLPFNDKSNRVKILNFFSRDSNENIYKLDTNGFSLTLKLKDKISNIHQNNLEQKITFKQVENSLLIKKDNSRNILFVYKLDDLKLVFPKTTSNFEGYDEFIIDPLTIYIITNGAKSFKLITLP